MTYFICIVAMSSDFIPPKFQWQIIDFDWVDDKARRAAIVSKSYIPENNMPTGLARWNDKLFITIPRWKKGAYFSIS